MIKRVLQIRTLKADRIEEYLSTHENIRPELVEEHRRAGTIAISSFLDGTDLYVYFEYDDGVAARFGRDDLPVRRKWQEWMKQIQADDRVTVLGEAWRLEVEHRISP